MKETGGFVAWIGLDWADRTHAGCLRTSACDEPQYFELEQQPDAIHQWVRQLRQRFQGQPVAMALEQSRGPLIYALMQYDFLVLYPVNPKTLADYRRVFRISGAKDDFSDARLLLDLLWRFPQQLQAWHPEDPETRALSELVRYRRQLVQDRSRLLNRLTRLLKEYYPQVLQWFTDLKQVQCQEFLLKWPSLESAQKARELTLRNFFNKHRSRRSKTNWRIQQINQAVALTQDPVLMQIHPLRVQGWVRQLKILQTQITDVEQQIQSRMLAHPEAEIFQSFPGAGPTIAPLLLVAFGTDRHRFDAYRMQCFSGIAPVTVASGNSRWVHHRVICPKFLKQTFHEFAQYSIPHSLWANAYYHQLKERGKSRHEAIRSLAYKWIRILTRCWKKRQPYCEQTYIDSLRRSHSPLIQRIDQELAA